MTDRPPSPLWPSLLVLRRNRWVAVGALLAVAELCLLVLLNTSMEVLAGARAYVGGESLYSKGQKDAVGYLRNFAESHAEADYQLYLTAIDIPLGDHDARLELQKPRPDMAVLYRGFVRGGNDPADVGRLIWLFRTFHQLPVFASVVEVWTQGDADVHSLQVAAARLHLDISSNRASPEQIRRSLDEIAAVNSHLTGLEIDFSARLGEASRWVQNVLMVAEGVATAVLLAGAGGLGAGRLFRRLNLSEADYREFVSSAVDAALHDALTGLPNRGQLGERIEQAIASGRAAGQPLALLLMDLDRFKDVNDTLGHSVGDRLLQAVGQRLTDGLRPGDMVARLGGDEFAVLLPATSSAEASARAVRLLGDLQQPFLLDELQLDVDASIGIALFPEHGEDAETLFRRADIAMYVAKRSGSGLAVYRADLDSHTLERLTELGELRRAIEAGDMVLHYQPQVDCRTGDLSGVEALVRWQHPERGLVYPDQFIPLAEKTGLISPLSRWVVEAAIMQCGAWLNAGQEIPVAVNLSMHDLHDPTLPAEIERLLTLHRLPARLLRLEITESGLMSDPTRALQTLAALSGLGLHIAVDDFGTGYSSLSYLTRLPVDELKIDRSFVFEMVNTDSDRVIVRSTIDLAHNLGLRVVAEGVEDAATMQLLKTLGCDEVQGYFMSRPLPVLGFAHWLAQSTARSDRAA